MSSVRAKSGRDYRLRAKYGNFIGGEWIAPAGGEYFEDISPVTGEAMTLIPRSQAEDIDRALDAAHEAAPAWGKTSPAERSAMLLKIADRMEENLPMLAEVETWDNGKSIRETTAADLPLAIDHFRYFAAAIRAEAGKPLASSPRIGKIAFTGETTTGRLIMQYASENIIPVTLEPGGKSPNIFF